MHKEYWIYFYAALRYYYQNSNRFLLGDKTNIFIKKEDELTWGKVVNHDNDCCHKALGPKLNFI